MKLVSGTSRDGLWSGSFSFPNYLPDGNYLYSLTIRDGKGYLTTAGPFSGIILDRNHPDSAETKIVTAIDGEGKTLPIGGTTNSPNITIVFEGTDKTGVIQSFECNLDDAIIFSEHGHGDDPGQASSPYSSCFDPLKVSAKSTRRLIVWRNRILRRRSFANTTKLIITSLQTSIAMTGIFAG